MFWQSFLPYKSVKRGCDPKRSSGFLSQMSIIICATKTKTTTTTMTTSRTTATLTTTRTQRSQTMAASSFVCRGQKITSMVVVLTASCLLKCTVHYLWTKVIRPFFRMTENTFAEVGESVSLYGLDPVWLTCLFGFSNCFWIDCTDLLKGHSPWYGEASLYGSSTVWLIGLFGFSSFILLSDLRFSVCVSYPG